MRFALALCAALLAGGSIAPALAQSPTIQGWLAANTQCKKDPGATKACATRDRLGEKLKRRGCEYQEDGEWWRCPRR